MNLKTQILKLEEASSDAIKAIIPIQLAVDDSTVGSWVTISRVGTFTDPRYGKFTLSREMFSKMINNFNSNVVGQDIAIDLNHDTTSGAAGYLKELKLQGNKFRGRVEWTEMGLDAVQKKGFKYLSAEIHPNFTDNETQEEYGATLMGAGLVVRPAIKRLDPVELADSVGSSKIYLSESAINSIKKDSKMFKELLKKLRDQLLGLTLTEAVVVQLMLLAEASLKAVTVESEGQVIFDQVFKMGEDFKTAYDAGETEINLTLNAATGSGLDEAGVLKLITDLEAKRNKDSVALIEAKDAKVKIFTDIVNKEKNGLEEADRKVILDDYLGLVSPDMSDEQIVKLAEMQVKSQNERIAASKRVAMNLGQGGGPSGNVVFVETPMENAIKLSGIIQENMKRSSHFSNGLIKLKEKVHPFVNQVLELFDFQNQSPINAELMVLADGTGVGQTALPVGFQREVIREALSDLNVLALVQTLVDATATATMQIPYETREVAAASLNSGIVPERSGIPRARVRQEMDLAYINAMKIAIECSNEVLHFTANSGINWDAWARNVGSASRLLRELVHARIANELQRVSDSFQAGSVVTEDIKAQLDGSRSVFKTASFPIVDPKQIEDLKGNAVGSAQNPITVTLNAVAALQYDGTNLQAGGTYYQIVNHNLGYIELVSELGVAVTPNHTANTATISYDYASNVSVFDLDLPASTKNSDHLDGLLDKVGSRKAILASDRFIQADFMLMSSILNDTCTNAATFQSSQRRDGRDTDERGDLARVKSIAAFSSDAPGIHLGDERILMGQSGVLSYGVSKPWSMSDMIEGRTSGGVLNATKEAYGEEYNCIHCPLPNKNRFTSVIAYSVNGRAAV